MGLKYPVLEYNISIGYGNRNGFFVEIGYGIPCSYGGKFLGSMRLYTAFVDVVKVVVVGLAEKFE